MPHLASPSSPPPSSQGRNIFSTFLLTFRAVYTFPGPVLEFIYLKVSFHSVRKKERKKEWKRDRVGAVLNVGADTQKWTEISIQNTNHTSDLAIVCIKMHLFLQEILVDEGKTKHQRCQVRESTLCNKYTCPLLGSWKKHTLASSNFKSTWKDSPEHTS